MKAIDKIGSAFLRRILRRMKQLGVSQTELARRMNVSRPYVTKVLSRDVNFSFRTAAKLANALKMDFFPELRERRDGDAASVNQTPVTAKLRKMV
jgi:transcriptional regulator with XRE-family HTH domain